MHVIFPRGRELPRLNSAYLVRMEHTVPWVHQKILSERQVVSVKKILWSGNSTDPLFSRRFRLGGRHYCFYSNDRKMPPQKRKMLWFELISWSNYWTFKHPHVCRHTHEHVFPYAYTHKVYAHKYHIHINQKNFVVWPNSLYIYLLKLPHCNTITGFHGVWDPNFAMLWKPWHWCMHSDAFQRIQGSPQRTMSTGLAWSNQ